MRLSIIQMMSATAFSGNVPGNYDQYMGPVFFEPYALDLITRLKKDRISRVLEIACGTGRVTRHLLELIPPDGRLVATDLNEDMIRHAGLKLKSRKLSWKRADAQNLPFENESFDHVICQFGVMFFPDKARAFAEAFRVLEKGGKFIFNTWDSMEQNPRITFMGRVMEAFLGNEAPDFMKKGPFSFFERETIETLMKEAGFVEVRTDIAVLTTEYHDANGFMKGFIDGSPLASYLSRFSKELQDSIRQGLVEAAIEEEKEYGKKVPCRAIVAEGKKPQ